MNKLLIFPLIGFFVGVFLIHGQRVIWGLAAMVGGVVLVWIVIWSQPLWEGIFRVSNDIEKAGERVNYESR